MYQFLYWKRKGKRESRKGKVGESIPFSAIFPPWTNDIIPNRGKVGKRNKEKVYLEHESKAHKESIKSK
jgi:hypothetical protein